jgi:glucose-6-phosphate 1-dehydrogenase
VIDKLVLFGATGDLAGRLLLTALAALHAADRLPEGFSLVGAASEDWDEDRFRHHVAQRLEQHAAEVPSASRKALVNASRYLRVDVSDPNSVARVVSVDAVGSRSGEDDGTAARPLVAYLALPPALFPTTVSTLGKVGLPLGSRIALEKPFGDDVSSAQALNRLLQQVTGDAGEQAVFRVDHTLGMATVANLIGLRMSNPVLEAVWNSTYIEQIDILWDETVALEGRAGYYDRACALKDVLQNHMLQVLSLVAMEPPCQLNERELRDAKVAALRAVRPLTEDDVATRTRRACYTAGRLADTGGADGREVPDYANEDGVDASRSTETYTEVLLELDNPR